MTKAKHKTKKARGKKKSIVEELSGSLPLPQELIDAIVALGPQPEEDD